MIHTCTCSARLAAALASVTALAITAAAPAADLRLFFSTANPGFTPPALPGTFPAVPGRDLNTPTISNPTLHGSGRLHLWATGTVGSPNIWNGIAVEITIVGTATIYGGGGLNVSGVAGANRWETSVDLSPPDIFFISVLQRGLRFPPDDDGFEDGGNFVYLGYLDIQQGGVSSQVFLRIGNAGIARAGGNVATDQIFLGSGDAALHGNDYGQTSAVADATIIPAGLGVCCTGADFTYCSLQTSSACADNCGIFKGEGSTCRPRACSPADFNRNAVVSVQDLFDFLAAYFSGT